MKLEILSPEGTLFSGTVTQVTFPGTAGAFTVLKDHASLISSLKEGEIVLYDETEAMEKTVPVKGGFVEVHKNNISVCIK